MDDKMNTLLTATVGMEKLQQANTPEAITQLMNKYSEPSFQSSAFDKLVDITQKEVDNLKYLEKDVQQSEIYGPGLKSIFRCMQNNSNNVTILRSGIQFLSSLSTDNMLFDTWMCFEKDLSCVKGLLPLIVNSVKNHSMDDVIQKSANEFVINLMDEVIVNSDLKPLWEVVTPADIISNVLNCMRSLPKDVEVQQRSIEFFKNITNSKSIESAIVHGMLTHQLTMIHAVINGMNEFKNNRYVQWIGVMFFIGLWKDTQSHDPRVIPTLNQYVEPIITTLMNVMQRCLDDARCPDDEDDVSENVMELLIILMGDKFYFQLSESQLSSIISNIDAFMISSDSENIQLKGIKAFKILLLGHPRCKKFLNSIMERILHSMLRFSDDDEICRQGIEFIMKCSTDFNRSISLAERVLQSKIQEIILLQGKSRQSQHDLNVAQGRNQELVQEFEALRSKIETTKNATKNELNILNVKMKGLQGLIRLKDGEIADLKANKRELEQAQDLQLEHNPTKKHKNQQ